MSGERLSGIKKENEKMKSVFIRNATRAEFERVSFFSMIVSGPPSWSSTWWSVKKRARTEFKDVLGRGRV